MIVFVMILSLCFSDSDFSSFFLNSEIVLRFHLFKFFLTLVNILGSVLENFLLLSW